MNSSLFKKHIYSFDIFDTCLCRTCGSSISLYEILSKKVIETLIVHFNNRNIEHFRQLFVAQREVENHSGGNLHQIYTRLCSKLNLPIPIERIIELELETESEVLKPIIQTLELVNKYRTNGTIAFISDMYLPSNFLTSILKKYDFYKDGDIIYVSEESKAYKSDGSLYRLIHEQESFSYSNWHHFGDNLTSDYHIPRKFGIHANHLSYRPIGYEITWNKNRSLRYPYAEILSGISRSVRLSEQGDNNQKLFVSDLSAPLIISWVTRIMKDAQHRGIEQLFFCARDAHSEYLVAQRLQPLFPNIKVKYLFVSRESMYNNNNLLLEYLQSIGVTNGKSSAIVDIVSTGKSSRIINDLLSKNNLPTIYSYYLFRLNIESDHHISSSYTLLNNVTIESTYALLHDPNWLRFNEQRVFFEILFTLNFHKKTIGYTKRANHITVNLATDTSDSWFIDNVRQKKRDNDKLLIAYTDAFINCKLVDYADDIIETIALPTWSSFIQYPKRIYLDYLHELHINGKPFITEFNLLKPDNCRWRRGSIVYSLPKKHADMLFKLYIWVKTKVHK